MRRVTIRVKREQLSNMKERRNGAYIEIEGYFGINPITQRMETEN